MAKTAIILYGFTEGNGHGQNMRAELQAHGYSIAHNVSQADVVISHSGGLLFVPTLRPDQFLVLINPPYWPGRSLLHRTLLMIIQFFQAMRPGNQLTSRIRMALYHVLYLFSHAGHNLSMVQRAIRHIDLAQEHLHDNCLIIRSSQDPWLTPNMAPLQANNPQLRFVTIPGQHVDCWYTPAAYIAMIETVRQQST